ncbi:YdcF family protein [Spirosoma panaciterrae]|uniref:YdcF family protein n=1 Tax=Spirosoma panaciterrae TaxID=496058 RepID=UPI00036CE95C|nr:YdcF family protein [Spirosoma panaciterrae]
MFYFFSKTISFVLTPAGWLVLVLVWAFFTKKSYIRRRLVGVALGLFWVFGNPFLTNELALWWEYPIQKVPAAPTDSTKRVAVVLTGGMINGRKEIPDAKTDPAHTLQFMLWREADRAAQALFLYKVGAVQKILISGGVAAIPFRSASLNDEGQMTARFLIIGGVRPDDIILENKSRNTHENAVFTAQMLHQRFRQNQCVLITSAWHMRRAIACFRKEGVRVTPFPTCFLSNQRSFAPGDWLLPHEEEFFNAYYLVRELVGYVSYWVAGYI